jgi:hypothetical protein
MEAAVLSDYDINKSSSLQSHLEYWEKEKSHYTKCGE